MISFKRIFHLPGVRLEPCNTVTYSDRRICAVKGSSVNIYSTYSSVGYVTSKFWFSPGRSHQWRYRSQPEDLDGDSQYKGRVQISDKWTQKWKKGHSTLTINDLRETDSAEYRFKFKTSQFQWGNDLHGTTLTVTGTDEHKLK